MGQLTERIQSSVLGNVGSLIVFRVGGQDAEKLEAEMAPVFKVKDMINLGKREFYVKLMIDGESYDPFSAETLKVLPPSHPSYKDRIVKFSREKYTISIDAAKRLIEEEESTIIRSAQEKAIITGKKDDSPGTGAAPEPLI
jgi:hypothetical protein